MLFIVLCLFAAGYLYYIFSFDREDRFTLYISFAVGLLAGVVAILVNLLIGMFFRPDIGAFIPRLLITLFGEYLLPLTIAYAILVYFLHSPPVVRIAYAVPRFFGLLSLYVPFLLNKAVDFPDSWPRFFVPLAMLAILFLAEFCITRYLSHNPRTVDWQDLLITLAPVLLALVLLSVAQVLWYFCFPRILVYALALVIIIPAAALRLRKYR